MKKLFILLIILTLGCSSKLNYINGNKIIRYGTTEFDDFEKKAKIKKEQAWAIKNKITSKQQVNLEHWLFFIIDKNYVFTYAVNSKRRETELSGIYVNSETGEVTYEKSGVRVKYKSCYLVESEKFPF